MAFTATAVYSKTAPLDRNRTTKAAVSSTKHSEQAKPVKKTQRTSKTGNKTIASKTTKNIAKSSSRKQASVPPQSTKKKQTLVSSKLAKKKHNKTSGMKQALKARQVADRRRSIISHHSIKTVPINIVASKIQQQETTPANISQLNLGKSLPSTTAEVQVFKPFANETPLQIQSWASNHKTSSAHVTIETSLFLDGLEAGLSKELIMQLIEIFAWDIDFATNLRNGDHFTVVYEKKVVNGKEIDTDEIIAAQFTNQGETYTALRYIDKSGNVNYYTPDGQSMQRAFLTTPVDFARISSHFDLKRKHPILNRIRAHKGVDYAARTGTPVKTTGDGVVVFCGRKGGYGQVVIIKHGDRYESLYAHLSKFKKGLKTGNPVKQGDVIGYVGQTGLATGPHLHYEFHVDGVYRNPETVKLPHSLPITESLLADFKSQTQPLLAQLNQIKAKSLFAKTQSEYN
jgi:murein DD-endopeptidase MepM/ murein hydrolase activator NlpD